MQQWSPDDIVLSGGGLDAGVAMIDGVQNPDFVEDRPADGAGSFMSRLEPDEREQLYKLVREEVSEEIRSELTGSYGDELELIRSMLTPLKTQLQQAVDDELHAVATGAIQLAVAIGERLARQTIEVDESYLVRCLEELVDRTQIGAELTVIAHPGEVARLERHREELKNLNVVNLVPEMALEAGGCIVKSAGQEWDLTFRGQADALAEMAREAMLYGKDTQRNDDPAALDVVEATEVRS